MSALRFSPEDHPHRRRNPLTGDMILVSPHRAKRPWAGQVDAPEIVPSVSRDPGCPLCPGSERAQERRNPDYQGSYVFANDFGALMPDTPDAGFEQDGFFGVEGVRGEARVVCYSEDHSKTLAKLTHGERRAVVECWAAQVEELSKVWPWVQIFENKGAMMGSSQPHPHGQIWASSFVPNDVTIRDRHQREYFERTGEALLSRYLASELEAQTRIVDETEHWVVLVPFWAAWPFETMVLPKAQRARFDELSDAERSDLAAALGLLTTRYDNLFSCSFPYSMGWHYAPHGGPRDHWVMNAVFYPPLLRSASVRKFMVGYEMLAEAQRDITPEQAAEALRGASGVHYTERSSL